MRKYKGLVFVDIDGVLAECSHRMRYAKKEYKDIFYRDDQILADDVIEAGANLVKMFEDSGYKILFVSSRRDSCRNATATWLKNNLSCNFEDGDLYLKETGDNRPSWEVKKDLIDEAIWDNSQTYHRAETNYFVDDYPANIEMVDKEFSEITTILFGCGRMHDNVYKDI